MKFIVTVIAAFAAMLSVAIADEWPRKKLRSTTTTAPTPKPPIRDAARPAPAPAQPDVLGRPAERGDALVAPPSPNCRPWREQTLLQKLRPQKNRKQAAALLTRMPLQQ